MKITKNYDLLLQNLDEQMTAYQALHCWREFRVNYQGNIGDAHTQGIFHKALGRLSVNVIAVDSAPRFEKDIGHVRIGDERMLFDRDEGGLILRALGVLANDSENQLAGDFAAIMLSEVAPGGEAEKMFTSAY